jgi:hypothetical protein
LRAKDTLQILHLKAFSDAQFDSKLETVEGAVGAEPGDWDSSFSDAETATTSVGDAIGGSMREDWQIWGVVFFDDCFRCC